MILREHEVIAQGRDVATCAIAEVVAVVDAPKGRGAVGSYLAAVATGGPSPHPRSRATRAPWINGRIKICADRQSTVIRGIRRITRIDENDRYATIGPIIDLRGGV